MNKHIATLGPVFLFWISQLHDKLAYLHDTRGYKALYCARAGKRIQDLMDAYTGGNAPFSGDLFGISRIGACKVSAGDPAMFKTVYRVTAETLNHVSLADLCKAYFQHSWDETHPQMAALARLSQRFDEPNFRALIAANDPAARYFRDTMNQNREGLRQWFRENLGDLSGYVLVDSGWKASIQALLAEAYPEFGFLGLYFGVMDTRPLENRFGVIFDSPTYQPGRPSTVFALHRHLVESILEPNAPSIEDTLGGPQDALARAQLEQVRNETPDPVADRLFLDLRDYIAANAGKPIDQIEADYRAALPRVADLLIYPDREDAVALAGKDRSVDFGREGAIPVLADDTDCTPDERIQRSLWPQGQIALEYEGATARRLQAMASGAQDRDYFASHEKTDSAASAPSDKPAGWEGSVAIVTRTKNRPLLFRRAAASVAAQTYRNYRWVVVNDGGDVEPVRAIIGKSGVDPRLITLVSNPQSVGMEAASNMGVRAVDTEYVVIHDDDDAWEPDFLAASVSFLKSPRAAAARFEGVLSRAWRVSEQIVGDRVVIHKTEPYMTWVSEVSLAQMAVGNFFAPISFLYRRSVYDAIGGYDESLPVLGDWRFNLDFLLRANIGFLDRYLAYYHHRDMGDSSKDGVYANSVVGGQSLHAQYFSVVTNGILRDPETPPAMAAVIANGHLQRIMEMNFRNSANDRNKALRQLMDGASDATAKAPSGPASLPKEDADYIRACIRRAIPLSPSPRKLFSRLRWTGRVENIEQPHERMKWLPRVLHLIPSPPDFDHIAYLRDHPEIWATVYNGPDQLLPYHHWLMEGIDLGYERPRLKAGA
ncbi:glycosyltransferase [Aliigemmobacter aestuarii]|nr:glycosyltransferase [Gemmobacter aestuarii]